MFMLWLWFIASDFSFSWLNYNKSLRMKACAYILEIRAVLLFERNIEKKIKYEGK